MTTSNYALRRQLREAREASGFASIFFGIVAFVALIVAGGIGWMFGSDGDLWWWIFMVVFTVSAVCSGAALYHWIMAGDDLRDLDRR